MNKNFLILLLIFLPFISWSQSGVIRGKVFNKATNEGIPLANVLLEGTTTGTSTNLEGSYELSGLKPGLYNLEVSYLGFKKEVTYEVQVTNARPAIVNFALTEESTSLQEIEVTASPFSKTEESPVSLRSIGPNEIRRSPGGNRDISKVIRTLPGAATVPSFRNDVIIRGGAPNENSFYLDGIEVPTINHFQTQGSSGGPVGLINVDFIEDVDFYSGAFPANRGGALSSVFEFKQKTGRTDKLTFNGIVSATDIGATLEGPVNSESSFIFSIRRSYLQFLFKALQLPFLPVYNDYQFKYTYNLGEKQKLSIISLGAIDDFALNLDANETEEQRYILNYLPVSEQWNYTIGAKYEYFRDNGFYTFVISRNMLDNQSRKWAGNDESRPENLLLKYQSREIENKLRLEDYRFFTGDYTFTYGLQYEFAKYSVDNYFKTVAGNQAVTRDFQSNLNLNKWGAFGQLSRSLFNNLLILSAGVRADATDYSAETNKLWEQLSPRFSAAWNFLPDWSLNMNVGRYYQLPSYVLLGYRQNEAAALINKENGIGYIRSDHAVAGIEYRPGKNAKITVESFYKWYDNYPFLLNDSVSLANLGADFGVIGNSPAAPISQGRAYGLELLAQQKLAGTVYGTLAYTLVRSEFSGPEGKLRPSSWDFRHIVSLTGGKRLPRNWELGARFLFSGGAPYTPYNLETTVLAENWDRTGQGIPDYQRLNTERLSPFHQLDFRIDKKYFFPSWSLNVYLDVQNAYGYAVQFQPNIDVVRDASGQPVRNPEQPNSYLYKELENSSGTTIPSIGIVVEL